MHDATRVFICGGSGSGKSTRAKQLMPGVSRIAVFDPLDEYAQEGYRRFTSLPDLGRYLASTPAAFRAAYVPPAGYEAQALHVMSNLLRDIQAGYKSGVHKSQLYFVVEEMNTCFPSHISADLSGFANLCSRGRHWGINLIGISQRPNEVNTRFRGNLEHVFVFRLIDHVDIKSLASALGAEYAAKIKALTPHQYLYRGLDGIIHTGKNRLN